MKIIKKFIILKLIFLLLCMFLASCTMYYGKYFLGRSPTFKSKPATEEDYKGIYEAVKKVALEYGFDYQQMDIERFPEIIFFYKDSKKSKGEFNYLKGAGAGPFSIRLFLKPSPVISIHDAGRIRESEFMKYLKKDLEKSLSEVIDMKGVKFEWEFQIPT